MNLKVKAEIQIDNKINYISPFYKNPLLQSCLGKCPICGESVSSKQEYIKLDENTYIHFDCYQILEPFVDNLNKNGGK